MVDDWDIIGDYGMVMENANWSQAFYDTSELPFPKSEIRDALINKYNEATDSSSKSLLRTGLWALTSFQDNIGSKPVRGTVNNIGLKISDDLNQLVQQIEKEGHAFDEQLFDSLRVVADREFQTYRAKLVEDT